MTFLTGFLMALADSVPGVSGGTIAYIMKRYELLFHHINKIIRREFNKESFIFLGKLAIGWVIGFVSAIFVITSFFETHIYAISSLFLGFIVASLIIIINQEKADLTLKISNIGITVVGFILVVFLVYFQNLQLISFDIENLNIISYIYLFFTGFIAICAMLLPGISGSAVLVIFGVYFFVIDSVHKFLTFDFSQTLVLIVFALGILCGGITTSRGIESLFKSKRTQMLHLIIGLLLGSIIAIINGPTSIENQNLDILTLSTFSIIPFIIGIGLLLILEFGLSKNNDK